MNVIVNPGQAVITRSGQGPYICTLDTAGRIQLTPPDPANSRIDLIVARIRDDRLGDTTTGFTVETDPGQAGCSTGRPAGPGRRPAAGTGHRHTDHDADPRLGDRRCPALGVDADRVGVLLPGDRASDAGAYAGQVRYRNGVLEAWDGGAWHATNQLAMFTANVQAVTGRAVRRCWASW